MSSNEDWTQDPEQMRLFEERVRGLHLPRRQFFKIVIAAGGAAALAACGQSTSKPASNAPSAGQAGSAPKGNLAKDQVFTTAALPVEPNSWDFNKDLYNNSHG